jgi:hypothetical protein
MRKGCVIGLLLMSWVVVACAESPPGPADSHRGFSWVAVDVWGNDTTSVSAVLIDQQGRREGWADGNGFYEIPGYVYYTDDDECCPDEHAAPAEPDSVPDTTDRKPPAVAAPPLAYYFAPQISGTSNALVSSGACDLLVTSIHAGVVTVTAAACRSDHDCGRIERMDSVDGGWRYRYRVSWKAAADTCDVRVALMSREKTQSPSK